MVLSGEIGKGMYFAAMAEIRLEGGASRPESDRIVVSNADALTVIVSAATGYRGFQQIPDTPLDDVVAHAAAPLEAIRTTPLPTLRARHIQDHQTLFRRVSLQLQSPNSAQTLRLQPTDKRLAGFAQNPDPSLIALYFQYGRYLLITSSRPGSQPANLQGIWNYQVTPPWSSNWTANINIQMNYWPAETCNLSECAEPVI